LLTYEPAHPGARSVRELLPANDILSHPQPSSKQSVRDQCCERIRQELAAGPQDSSRLDNLLKVEGYSEATIRRARSQVGVRTERVGFGAGSKVTVRLFRE